MATTFQQCGDQKKGVSEQWLVQKPGLTEFKKKKNEKTHWKQQAQTAF